MTSRRPLLGFDQPSVGAVAVGVIFRLPAAADGDGRRLGEFQDMWFDARDRVGAVAKGQVLGARAAAIGDAFGNLLYDGGFDEIFVGEAHVGILQVFRYGGRE